MPHVLADRHQRFYIGGVAGPHLAADRPAFIVNDHPDDHLLEIRPVILAEAPFAETLSAFPLEVDRGGIKENQLEAAEQITPAFEHVFFDQLLVAPGRQIGSSGLVRKLLSQKRHRTVKMMKFNRVGTGNGVISSPAIAIPVGTGCHQSMQDGEKNRSFDIELEAARLQQSLQRLLIPVCSQSRSKIRAGPILIVSASGSLCPVRISMAFSEYRERDRISVSTRPFSCR